MNKVKGLPWRLAPLAASIALALQATAAHPQESDQQSLEEIVVKGQLLRAEDGGFTATVLTSDEIRRQSPSDIDELFDRVPGMAVRDFQLGGVANSIVIRGFGGGGHGGDLGAVIDGIPLNEAMSHADGYVDLNIITPLEIESFTVSKGPVSALYGNFNRGGLVNIATRKSGDYLLTDMSLGSNATGDLQAAYGIGISERQQVNLAAQHFRTDGYRPQSESERTTLSGRWAVEVTPRLQVAVSGRYHSADSDSASYLLRSQFLDDRDGIDPRAQNDGAEKDFATVRTDVNFALSDSLKLLSFAYTTQQEFTRWFSRPVSATSWRQREESYDRSVHGIGTSLNGRVSLGGEALTFIVGAESFRESTEFEFYDNLDNRVRVGPALSDRETRLNSWSAFAEVSAPLHRLAQLSLGLRADRFAGGCRLLGPEAGTDPCGDLNDPQHVSPKFAVRSEIASWLQMRASWAEGFALPNGFVKYSVGGQPLDETVFRQTEISAHIAAGSSFDFDVAAYRLTSDGEVRTVSPGVFENFGATRRRGIEASASWQPLAALKLNAVYGVTEAKITQNASAPLLGLDVPGVPGNSAEFEVQYSPLPAWTLSAAWRFVGDYAIDAPNILRAESYGVVDASVAYRRESGMPYRLYARVENLADKQYATTELLLAGQAAVAPGPERAVRVGVQVDFR
jgi:outer membrane receptor protein involved in Fe transport